MEQPANVASKPLGVIDAVRLGIDIVNRNLWLLALPVLVDLLLWQGPRLSISPLVRRGVDMMLSQPDAPADLARDMTAYAEQLRALGDNFNLLILLAGTILPFPSFFARSDAALEIGGAGPVIVLSWEQAALFTLILLPLGLLIASIWLALLARSVDNGLTRWRLVLRRAGWIWLNGGLYLLALIVFSLALSGLFVLLMSVIMLVAGAAGLGVVNFLFAIFLGFSLWLSVGLIIALSFVVAAIALDGVNVARAVWRSLNVVGRNFSSTVGLLLLLFIITEGFARIWLRLSVSDWGVALGIVGSAYLGSALTAALFQFYRARYQSWQRVRSEVANTRREG
ncbi:MAG: hypothetical protein GXP42_09215 [Chloroflexi bacterium]|nr:hypothetical protein [Chloroflexota bacterium]